MSTYRRFHLNETIRAMTTSENSRFFVQVLEPPGEHRHPRECYRWNLKEAQDAADKIVQGYYPHKCDDETCGAWSKLD
jgi:hypothetical protein